MAKNSKEVDKNLENKADYEIEIPEVVKESIQNVGLENEDVNFLDNFKNVLDEVEENGWMFEIKKVEVNFPFKVIIENDKKGNDENVEEVIEKNVEVFLD